MRSAVSEETSEISAVIQPVNLAFRKCTAEKLLIMVTELHGSVKKLCPVCAIKSYCDQGIEMDLLHRDRSLLCILYGKIKASSGQKQEKEYKKERTLYFFS